MLIEEKAYENNKKPGEAAVGTPKPARAAAASKPDDAGKSLSLGSKSSGGIEQEGRSGRHATSSTGPFVSRAILTPDPLLLLAQHHQSRMTAPPVQTTNALSSSAREFAEAFDNDSNKCICCSALILAILGAGLIAIAFVVGCETFCKAPFKIGLIVLAAVLMMQLVLIRRCLKGISLTKGCVQGGVVRGEGWLFTWCPLLTIGITLTILGAVFLTIGKGDKIFGIGIAFLVVGCGTFLLLLALWLHFQVGVSCACFGRWLDDKFGKKSESSTKETAKDLARDALGIAGV